MDYKDRFGGYQHRYTDSYSRGDRKGYGSSSNGGSTNGDSRNSGFNSYNNGGDSRGSSNSSSSYSSNNGNGGYSNGNNDYRGGSNSSNSGNSWQSNSNSYNNMPKSFGKSNDKMAKVGGSLPPVNWQTVLPTLPRFEKNFYTPHPDVTKLSPEELDRIRRRLEISISGSDVPKPVTTFEQASFPDYIMEVIKTSGFKEPTAIQSQGWPIALKGRDVIGLAETGSGKTLSFILPSIVHINAQPILKPGDGPIVLSPCPYS